MKRSTRPEDWPEDLIAVARTIGLMMDERRLHPSILDRLPAHLGAIIPDHVIRVTHISRSAALPAGAHYEIAISGPRWDSVWSFRSGELEQLARACLPNV